MKNNIIAVLLSMIAGGLAGHFGGWGAVIGVMIGELSMVFYMLP